MKPLLRWLFKFLRGHKPAMVGFCLLSVVVLAALIGPLLTPYDPMQPFEGRFAPPSAAHWLGLDSQGYDILTRWLYGARTTLLIALAATLLSLVLGTLIGATAGYAGGWTDNILMRLVDMAMSLPGFLLAMVTVAVLGQKLENVIVAVGLVGAPPIARQIRAEVMRVTALEFMTAARALGVGPSRLLFRHALPNAIGPLIVLATLNMGGAILDVAGLNFLGLGGDPYRVPEWGLMLTQAWDKRPDGTLQIVVAAAAIFITVLGFNLMGDGLKDELDPRSRRRR